MDNLWFIEEKEFDIKKNKHYEGAFTQGTGYLSIRGSFEEGLTCEVQDEEYMRMPANVTLEKLRNPISKWGTYVPGIVGYHPLLHEEIVNLPFFLEFIVTFDEEKLDMNECSIEGYKRYLNMKNGVLTRVFIWNTKKGVRLQMNYKRYISMYEKNLCVQEINIKVLKGSGKVSIESGINANVRTNGYNHFNKINSKVANENVMVMETVTDTGCRVVESCRLSLPKFFNYSIKEEKGRIYLDGYIEVNEGDNLNFIKLSSICTDRDLDTEDPYIRALKCLEDAENTSLDVIFERHEKIWHEKWNLADIKIKGDDISQIATRFSIYHLIRSNNEFDPRVAICAKGYAGEAYFGHYFWDTEIYLLPFFLYTNPSAAKNLMLFRYNTLKGAKENAAKYGYNGARYPWESSISGKEECPNWQYADNEIHVTADVVYGMWHYYKSYHDYDFLKNYAVDVFIETSRYWVQRVDKNSCGGYDLLGVMGPDEYTAFSKNNAYTNRMVKFNLEIAVETLNIIKNYNENDFYKVKERLGLTEDELILFLKIADSLKIPRKDDLILQSEDFMEFADIDFNKVWKDRTKPFGHFVSQERMYRSKCLKQADVLAMMMLYPYDFTKDEIERAFSYYEPITTHDSSLSYVVHSIIANKINRYDEAEKFFRLACEIDINNEKGGASEGIHIANCGGIYQAIVYGFAGLESAIWSDELKLNPHLPSTWEYLEFSVIWKNEIYHIHIENCCKYKIEKLKEVKKFD